MPQRLKAHFPLCRHLRGFSAVALEGSPPVTEPVSRLLAASMLYPADGDVPCLKNHETDMILRGVHPDVILCLPAEKKAKSLSVDDVRNIIEKAHFSPNQAPGLVFILPRADGLSSSVQNTLLKITEEPPFGARFIFLLENRHSLLPTLQSRLVAAAVSEEQNLPKSFSKEAAEMAELLPEWGGLVDKLGAKTADRLLFDCAGAREAILEGSVYELLIILSAQEKKREEYTAFCTALRAVCARELLSSPLASPRLLRAVSALEEAAIMAEGNVQLSLLSCHTAAAIMEQGLN